jgi:peptide deformylase
LEHLEGKLFVDRLSKLKQQRIKKRLEKQAKETM